MCGRRLIFGRGAGFSAWWASSISSHSFRFGSKSTGFVAAGTGDPDYSNDLSYGVSVLTCGFVFAQVPSLQIDAYVRRREANERRRFVGLGESFVSLERTHSA